MLKDVLACPMSGDEVKRLAHDVPASWLYDCVFDSDSRVARNAAWALTHKPAHELVTLSQERLVDLALATPDTSLRRLSLALVERQGVGEEDMRTDLLDFCLQHMRAPDEPAGVQALCMKLAYQMCGYYPELMREFEETLGLMQPDMYKPGMRHLIKKLRISILNTKN
jgi:hypothetical protein